MTIFKYIDAKVFFISLCVGILYCYLTQPKPRIILKCPTPENENIVTYKDLVGNCFKYKSTEVSCPKDNNKITLCNH